MIKSNVCFGVLGVVAALLSPHVWGPDWGMYVAGLFTITSIYNFQDAARGWANLGPWRDDWRRLNIKKNRRWDDDWRGKVESEIGEIVYKEFPDDD